MEPVQGLDPPICPKCGSKTYRFKWHWPSAVRCAKCGAKIEKCTCASRVPGS